MSKLLSTSQLCTGLLILCLYWAVGAYGFLDDLPLTVSLATGAAILEPGAAPVNVTRNQYIAAIFSRPIIALGSDFEGKTADSKVPFSISCAPEATPPGRLWWVSTSLVRWDPDSEWPSDLKCQVALNTNLTSYDGLTLNITQAAATPRLLQTDTQQLYSYSVKYNTTSDRVVTVTVMAEDEDRLEVPPNGVLQLLFQYNVSASLVAAALKLEPNPDGLSLAVDQCVGWAGTWSGVTPASKGVVSESRCVNITFSAPLKTETNFSLVLPQGSRYSNDSGPSQERMEVSLSGIGPFLIDFLNITASTPPVAVDDEGIYRRLKVWLPHGLSPDTELQALVRQISVCELLEGACNLVPITSYKLLDNNTLQLQVDGLKPKVEYRWAVNPSTEVKNAYNQTLQASQGILLTKPVASYYEAPKLQPFEPYVAVFDRGQLPPKWPVLSQGPAADARTVYAWPLQLDSEKKLRSLVDVVAFKNYRPDVVFGSPAIHIDKSTTSIPTVVSVPLPSSRMAHLVEVCCDKDSGTRAGSTVQLLLQSQVRASWLSQDGEALVWVTHSDTGAPIANAQAYLYKNAYPDVPILAGNCVTNDMGVCTLAISDTLLPATFAGLVQGPDSDLSFTDNIMLFKHTLPAALTGTLVLDRALVRPGDVLHITGYINQRDSSATGTAASNTSNTTTGSGWYVPTGVTKAQLVIVPTSGDAGRIEVEVDVSQTYGSFHANVTLPTTAARTTHTISLIVNPAGSDVDGSADAQTATRRLRGVAWQGCEGEAVESLGQHHKPCRKLHHLQQAGRVLQQAAEGEAVKSVGRALQQTAADRSFIPPQPVVNTNVLATATFQVSDPRQPTADLRIEVADFVNIGTRVIVKPYAMSYLGANVAKAAISVKWHASDNSASGVLDLVTDRLGSARGEIDLSALPENSTLASGGLLHLEASWIGPTREAIVRTATVRVQEASRRVIISQALTTHTPGVPFGVRVGLVGSDDVTPILGARVGVFLSPDKDSTAECNTTSFCGVISGNAGSIGACQLELPCVGHFILKACTSEEERTCSEIKVGRTRAEWEATPWSGWTAWGDTEAPIIDSALPTYDSNDTIAVQFFNPWNNASALMVWRSLGRQTNTQVVQDLAVGTTRLELPANGTCAAPGCAMSVILVVPRAVNMSYPVPTSKVFDPNAPHTHFMHTTVKVKEDRDLTLAVDMDVPQKLLIKEKEVPVLAPGDNGTITIKVTDGDQAVEGAEVTVIAVDKSFLDLLPYPLQQPLDNLLPAIAATFRPADSGNDQHVPPSALDQVMEVWTRRLGQDPWIPAAPVLMSREGAVGMVDTANAVDINDTTFFDKYSSYITTRPRYAGPEILLLDIPTYAARGVSAMPASSAAAVTSASADGAGSTKLRLTSLFQSTPLFTTVTTDAAGTAKVTFTAPMNMGTFIIRAYVTSRNAAKLGSVESSVVVRQPLSLTASLPRVVRVSDTFMGGVLITAPDMSPADEQQVVKVRLELSSPSDESDESDVADVVAGLLLLSPTTLESTLLPVSAQREVRWNMQAVKQGKTTLRFSFDSGEDTLETTLDILPQQLPVYVATTFAVSAAGEGNDTQAWQRGLELPAALPGSGTLDLTAGVGYLPAILAATDAVAAQAQASQQPLDAQSALALACVPSLLGLYGMNVSDEQAGNATAAYQTLISLTNPQYGLLPYSTKQWDWEPTRTDVILNSQAAWLVTRLAKKQDLPAKLLDSVSSWKAAAAQQLVRDATDTRAANNTLNPRYSDWITLGWFRLAVGPDWEVSDCNDTTTTSSASSTSSTQGALAPAVCSDDAGVRTDLSFRRQVALGNQTGLTARLMTGLTMQSTYGSQRFERYLPDIIDDITPRVRMSSRTAYVSDAPGSTSAASLDTQALALQLLLSLARPEDTPLVQKLANYLSAPASSVRGSFASVVPPLGQPAWAVALTAVTLAAYDQASNSTQPNLVVEAYVNDSVFLEATFDNETVGTPPVRTSTPWEELADDSKPGPLSFSVTGTGQASVSVGLSFIPSQLLDFPSYRGIWVTQVIQATDPITGQPTGPALRQAPLASLLTVSIQVVSPDDLGPVTIQALTSGGLEPLDPALAYGDSSADVGCSRPSWGSFIDSWWWPVCPAKEVRPSVVTWKYQSLRSGAHTVSYKAVAATEGTFLLPSVKAWADNQPEVMGMTATSTVIICSGTTCTTKPASDSASPKSCESNCSSNGVCNIRLGKCICNAGWKGAACEQQAA